MKRIGELITDIFDNDCLFVSVCEKICINFRRNKNQQIHTNPTQKKINSNQPTAIGRQP